MTALAFNMMPFMYPYLPIALLMLHPSCSSVHFRNNFSKPCPSAILLLFSVEKTPSVDTNHSVDVAAVATCAPIFNQVMRPMGITLNSRRQQS